MTKKIDLETVKKFWNYIGRYKLKLFGVTILIILSVAANVCLPIFLKVIIDNHISPLLLEADPNFSSLLRTIILMAAIYFIGVVCALLYTRSMVSLSQAVLKEIRDDMFCRMQTLPIKYFDTHSHGSVMSYYTNDTEVLEQAVSQGLPQMLYSLISILVIFTSMLYISLWLSLIVTLFIFTTMKFLKRVISKSAEYFVKQQESLGKINGYIEEMINGQKVVKVFCYENKAMEKFDLKNDRYFEASSNANKYSNILMPSLSSLGYLLYIIIATIGGSMAIAEITNISLTGINILSLGMIAAFLQLSINFMNPISQISNQFNSIVTALAGFKRISGLLSEAPEIDNGKTTLVKSKMGSPQLEENKNWIWKHINESGKTSYKNLKGDIEFCNVNFGYNEGENILHNINIHAKQGEKIALVGGTGSGKTTTINLINRFYDVSQGAIKYDGINVNSIKKSDLRKSLGIVLQDVKLFTGSILENIRYGNLDATDEECINAAKLAHADSFVSRLPEGYNTLITSNGSNLSQGQRQLLSIARAAVANPPVMILDEATSSIDTNTEKLIQAAMDKLMKGRTVFVIAHRLSTICNSDSIILLEKGQIAEQGTHEKLLELKGKYYQLYTGNLSQKLNINA